MWEVSVLAEAVEKAWAEDYWIIRHFDITLISREAEFVQRDQRGRSARRERRRCACMHQQSSWPPQGTQVIGMVGTKGTKVEERATSARPTLRRQFNQHSEEAAAHRLSSVCIVIYIIILVSFSHPNIDIYFEVFFSASLSRGPLGLLPKFSNWLLLCSAALSPGAAPCLFPYY